MVNSRTPSGKTLGKEHVEDVLKSARPPRTLPDVTNSRIDRGEGKRVCSRFVFDD
jgi:hypothetical protein